MIILGLFGSLHKPHTLCPRAIYWYVPNHNLYPIRFLSCLDRMEEEWNPQYCVTFTYVHHAAELWHQGIVEV